MKADERGVGGFFEDLPVLVFVLGGVSMLVGSSLWASAMAAEARTSRELHIVSECGVELLVADLTYQGSVTPTVQKLRAAPLGEVLSEVVGVDAWAASVWVLHPERECLRSENSSGCVPVVASCCASGLFCAVEDSGLVVPVEVRLVVWQSEV